ncbi:TPA_asm: hypothetical protein vir530_00016 [dsDNA virus vir530]|nr:TPA_asm: hypothetical protein vir530_00016 [dsDNA virus vir530]
MLRKKTPQQKANEAKKKAAWIKAEKPHWSDCLSCKISCEQNIQFGESSYSIVTCPVRHVTEPFFPYKYRQMRKEAMEQVTGDNENGQKGKKRVRPK